MSALLRAIQIFLVLAVATLGLTAPQTSEAQLVITVAVPAPMFEVQVGGPLVYVGSGLWVLPDSDEEVFYSRGWYWARHGDYWYRSHGRSGGWHPVGQRYVPASMIRMERGRYHRWHAPQHARQMAPRGWEPRQQRPMARPAVHDNRHGEKEHFRGKGPKLRNKHLYFGPAMAPQGGGHGKHKGKKGGGEHGRGH